MRTREQLNDEYEKIEVQIKKERWVAEAALISMGVVILSCLLGYWCQKLDTLATWGIGLGFLGMIVFGGRATHLHENKKYLKEEWQKNGYGLKKYPNL